MYQRDYLLRIIEQLTAVMMRVVLQVEAKNYTKALIEIELAYQTLLSIDPNLVKQMTTDELLAWLRSSGVFDAQKSIIVAELLREEAKIRAMESRFTDAVLDLLIKAFCLYEEAMTYDSRFDTQEYEEKVDRVAQTISKYELPLEIQFRLFQRYERRGSFDKAEDVLHELMDRGYSDIAVEGRAFYARLLEKSDAELVEGNLPRDEVQEGLGQFVGVGATSQTR